MRRKDALAALKNMKSTLATLLDSVSLDRCIATTTQNSWISRFSVGIYDVLRQIRR
jgi:hypothetical protein